MANRSQMGTDLMAAPSDQRDPQKCCCITALYRHVFRHNRNTAVHFSRIDLHRILGFIFLEETGDHLGLIDLAFDDTLIIFMDAPVF